jgi:hypothetical protein
MEYCLMYRVLKHDGGVMIWMDQYNNDELSDITSLLI